MIKVPRSSNPNPHTSIPNKLPKLYELRDGSFTSDNPHETNLKKLKRDDPELYSALKRSLKDLENLDDRLKSESTKNLE